MFMQALSSTASIDRREAASKAIAASSLSSHRMIEIRSDARRQPGSTFGSLALGPNLDLAFKDYLTILNINAESVSFRFGLALQRCLERFLM
jgi:hypothetical protein